MSKATAIHPDYFRDFREAQVAKEPTTADEAVKEEALIADIAEMPGWNYLKKYILDLEDVLDTLVKSAMENGATYEEIGQKSIVSELGKSYLTRVIERVEDAKNARTALQTTS